MEIIQGVVQRGEGRGGALGYPTINLPLAGTVSGVYAGRVQAKGEVYTSAIFADPARGIIEAHLLDFRDDLYGSEAIIEVHEKIRDTKKFDTEDALKEAIADDVAKVREYFKN
jgi:riboflavin kinase / FMN adenylyltransferase